MTQICIPLNDIGCRTCAEQVGVTPFWVSPLTPDLAVRNEGDRMDLLDLVAFDFSVVRLDWNGGASSVLELAAVSLDVLPSISPSSLSPFSSSATSSGCGKRYHLAHYHAFEACGECRCPGNIIGEIERVLETRSSVCTEHVNV